MSDLLTRTFLVRIAPPTGDQRVISCRCVPYGIETLVADPGVEPYLEVFHPGAFARAHKAPDRVHVRFEHNAGIVGLLGRGLAFAETDEGLDGELTITRGAIGDHALSLVDDGIIAGVSVGFVPLTRRPKFTPTGAIIRDRCHLEEVSLAPTPAYEGAVITGRRTKPEDRAPTPEPVWTPERADRLRAAGVQIR